MGESNGSTGKHRNHVPLDKEAGDDEKKKTLKASEQDPLLLLRWLARLLRLDPLRLVFLDESGFRLDMTPLYAYAPKGERAYGSVPKNRGKSTSLIAAMSLDEGVMAAMTIAGAVDGLAFEVYVKEVLCPKLRPAQLVIMDRLSVHRRKEVTQAIEARGCEVLFLPPYSPELNPIELAFSKIKEIVRRMEARTREALDDAIAKAIRTITLQDVIGWFNHAGYGHHSL